MKIRNNLHARNVERRTQENRARLNERRRKEAGGLDGPTRKDLLDAPAMKVQAVQESLEGDPALV
ncbi:hypothetical protein V5R04_06980 [Jonesiaceae bacterium BS-20]|uniref:DUF4169 family protein n=1 Tax=Jonesiaceae bacterium BS-20 TaxID=3120821 RepID=A0AAU7DZ14_9MICO